MQKHLSKSDLDYFNSEELNTFVEIQYEYNYTPYDSISPGNNVPCPADISDLVRLHKLIRQRRVLCVLEFGCGFSSIIMADALAKNKADYEAGYKTSGIRCLHPFQLFSIDADEHWIQEARNRLPSCLREIVTFAHSDVHIGTFNDRICSYYDALPDVTPDFIYLDGPAGKQVRGSLNGSSFCDNLERTVISADLLRLEPTFTPGTFIIVDGRTNNARFLKNNFQRNWNIVENPVADITTFELCTPPLGVHNLNRLKFQGLL
jgi:hypothetical protein